MCRSTAVSEGLKRLEPVKLALDAASRRAADGVRSCASCDAHCCRIGCNSMRVSRLEAEVIARRLAEPDLAPLVPQILERARGEVRKRGLRPDRDTTYDCPLLSPEGRCLVHGPSQPAGCLTFRPVEDGGCDHDLPLFRKHENRILNANRTAWGRDEDPLPIPIALLKTLPPGSPRRP